MAFGKTKTKKGYPVNYHKIFQSNINLTERTVNVTIVSYKDKATKDADLTASMGQFSKVLGVEYLGRTPTNGSDTMRNIITREAYKTLKELAIIEAAKPAEEQDEDLAFFADAVEV